MGVIADDVEWLEGFFHLLESILWQAASKMSMIDHASDVHSLID